MNRAEAVKFAMFENGNRPQAIMVPGIFELDLSRTAARRRRLRLRHTNPRRARRLKGPGSVSRQSHVDTQWCNHAQSHRAVAGDRIIEPMLDLARCSNLNRIIVAGASSAALMFELHRRGYVRVATTANRGVPAGQYDVALVDWRERRSRRSTRRSVGFWIF